jgi:hypothetical protein
LALDERFPGGFVGQITGVHVGGGNFVKLRTTV